MPASLPPPAATAPESATTALYRAALGPVNTGDYLPLFARFDEAGRAGPAWNWAAALITLNWLVFRQLWMAALVYVACAEGLALLVIGLGRNVLHWPAAVEWGVLGALLVLCVAIPGAYGNAWLHADVRRRMTRAVREARTVKEACTALQRQASTGRRLWALVVLNLLLVVALLVGYRAVEALRAGPEDAAPPSENSVTGSVQEQVAAPQAEPDASALATPSAEVAEDAPAASAPDAGVPPAEPAASEPLTTVETEPAPAEAEPKSAPKPILAPPTPSRTERVPAAQQGFVINVGLFADPANAEKAHARLLETGLPASLQVLDMPKGPRTRVRAGPFTDRPAAEAAAERIRALGLEAQITSP
ncbi:SPOR domain-containing protein [Hydrogenophaga sp.]|uniref:SPOR domain-containing protein n=1 Tax=Hydrogenophaga sp. TaxID=1904254 RepID=UPI00262706BA|nr:SPOR domain-containing protein [Hydrogenophaga sp.]